MRASGDTMVLIHGSTAPPSLVDLFRPGYDLGRGTSSLCEAWGQGPQVR